MSALFDVQRNSEETRLTIRRSLDINSAPALAEEIDKIVATRPSTVNVDLGPLDLIDSSGVGALVRLYRGVGHRAFTIWGVRDQPLAILRLLGMDKVFKLMLMPAPPFATLSTE